MALKDLSEMMTTQESLVDAELCQDGQICDSPYLCLHGLVADSVTSANDVLAVHMGVSSCWELMHGVIPDHPPLQWLAL